MGTRCKHGWVRWWVSALLITGWGCADDDAVLRDPGPHAETPITYPPLYDEDSGVPPECVAWPPPTEAGRIALSRRYEQALLGSPAITRAVELVQHPSEDEVWYLASQDGQVAQFRTDGDGQSHRTVLDIADRLHRRNSENGLVSFALHPRFARTRHAFVVYSTLDESSVFVSRLSRFTLSEGDAPTFADERVLIDIPQKSPQHTGNHVLFGHDGYLYYAVGDDRQTDVSAQSLQSLQGKVLRIDVDRQDAARDRPYAIPADNPFADSSAAPEVFAYGFRNPWRLAVDGESGAITVADVGEDSREEINLLQAGGNYGWPRREGTLCFRADTCDTHESLDPVAEVNHPAASSIVAGATVRSSSQDALQGRYLFADFISGSLFSVALSEGETEVQQEFEGTFNVPTMVQGRDGRIYLLRYEASGAAGGIYEVVDNAPRKDPFPRRLSQTGCVDMDAPTRSLPGVTPFVPISPLWSDGADKHRGFALPKGERIDLDSGGDFLFPDGSVLVKHFTIDSALVETRLFMRYAGTWTGYSYRYRPDGQEADLVERATDVTLDSGQGWHFPSRSECNRCHTPAAGYSLGLELSQLDHRTDDGSNQIDALRDAGLLTVSGAGLRALRERVDSMPSPSGSAPLARRARAYLHANCSNCHRPAGPGRGDLDLRFEADYDGYNACNQKPRVSRLWGVGRWGLQYIIVPGSKEDSTLWLRMTVQGLFRMPPLSSERVDHAGADVVGAFIDSLTDCEDMKASFDL